MTGENDYADGEVNVLLLHPHWKVLLRPVIALGLAAAGAAVLLVVVPPGRYAGPVRIAVGAVAVLAAVVWFLVPYLRWRTTTYELTTRRLRLRSGVLSRSGRDFPLTRISDVSFSHGLADRILGCGRLVVESAGEHGQLVLREIPHVAHVQAAIFQLVEDEQERLAREGDQP